MNLILYALILIHGAFEYKTGSPESLFPGQYAIHDYSTPSVMMSPALLPFAEGLLINCAAGRPYSQEELSTLNSAVQYGQDGCGLQASWNSFGADFYREETFSIKGGYSLLPWLHSGISGNLYHLRISMDELKNERNDADGDIALMFTPAGWINAAFTQTGVATLLSGKENDLIYPERSAGILIRPGDGMAFTWNITDTAADNINTVTATINPTPFFSVKGGYCLENSSFAASFGVLAGNFFVTYGLKYHPYLGYSHSAGITFTLNPAMESISSGHPFVSPPAKKMNIKNASLKNLENIKGLSRVSAERMVLYREKVGPLTEKALAQIGLTAEEINIFKSNFYGLERSHINREAYGSGKKTAKRQPLRERVRDKFRLLVREGIPAFTAITYSELSEKDGNDAFMAKLDSDSSISEDQKKIIVKICIE